MVKMLSEQESQKTEPITVKLLEEIDFESTPIRETRKKMRLRLIMDMVGATAGLRDLIDNNMRVRDT